MIDLAGLLAAAALLVTLVALEVRRVGPDAGQPARPVLLGRTVSPRVVAVMWMVYLLLFLPRVLGLLA
jgi:preprotein translocase subunit SecD